MKTLKTLLILFMTASVLVSCKKDDDGGDNAFLLSNENLSGTYNFTLLEVNSDQTIEVNGIPVSSNINVVGDTFQVDFVFNANGTYTAEGQYRITTTVTVAGQSEISTEIIVFDESGDYTLDANNQTIEFSTPTDSFTSGKFNITLFNENQFQVEQIVSQTIQGVDTDTETRVHFVRI
ncbi:MAG: hypothetical protein AAFP76_01815 [Bacteroidota bacterium]